MERDIQRDIERAFDALRLKTPLYDRLWAYYDGDQPLAYSTERLRRMFDDLRVRFTQNWCAMVVDSTLDRIELAGFDVVGDEAVREALNAVWADAELALEAHAVHLATLVCGEAYLIVWPGENGGIDAYYNDPRLCHMFYAPDAPKREDYAAKCWVQDGRRYMTLYYPDRLVYCAGPADAVSGKAMTISGEEANPYGYIPVFHFRREIGRRAPRGELANVIGLQDAVNKLLADMMVAAEFGAFRQRWVISSAGVGNLRNAPNEVWDLPAADAHMQPTQVGEFGQVDLRVFLDAIDNLAIKLSVITRTPKHYLLMQGGDPSGEALIAMETPLLNKVERLQETIAPVWRQVGDFILKLSGLTAGYGRIRPVWKDPRITQPLYLAHVRELAVRAGVPLVSQLRREGWSEAEIAQLQADRMADAAESEQLRQARAQRLLLETQLGVSQESALAQMGYSADVEQERRKATSVDAAEQLLTAMERRDG